MRQVEGTGAFADRLAFLRAIEEIAPRVLWTLRKLLTGKRGALLVDRDLTGRRLLSLLRSRLPPSAKAAAFRLTISELNKATALTADLNQWALGWNLAGWNAAGVRRGEWMLETAGETLHAWATLGPSAARRWMPGWAGFGESSIKLGEDHAVYRSRDKRNAADDKELLRASDAADLVALVGWQVLEEGAVKAGKRWAEARGRKPGAYDQANIARKMNALAGKLDLPPRPPAKGGRPRLAG